MLTFDLKFGKETMPFCLEEKNCSGVLQSNELNGNAEGEAEVKRALKEPIGSKRLGEIVCPGETIAIITSDITRPMPSEIVLPPIISELENAGIARSDITIVFALGSHRSHTEAEKKSLLGEKIYQSGITILDSDMNRCVNLGTCRNGTPVDIFEPVVKADRIVCLGNIEYHYFAGYSGGAKAIMPGVSSRAAIQANHSNMIKPGAFAGNLDNNPVRQDIEQAADFIKIDFIVNVILDEKKKIVKAVAGHHRLAHREGCKILDAIYKMKIDNLADIVVASAGGYPKDINLYQAQKGLDNASHAVREGGIIILCASAAEGFGEKTFEEWMTTMKPAEMIKEIKANFKLGGHKAAAIAMVLLKVKIYMVTELDKRITEKIGFVYFKTLQEALDSAICELGEDSKVLVLPQAGSTLPYH